ncbi:phosphopantetheine-binding protein [Streptomycetaceae bacterium NBC_01309]
MRAPISAKDLRDDVIDQLQLDPEEFGDDDDLVDFGLDSLRLLTLADVWGERYGAAVPFEELAEHTTLTAWAALLGSAGEDRG